MGQSLIVWEKGQPAHLSEFADKLLWAERQAQALQQAFDHAGQSVLVRYAMTYGSPSIASQLDALKAEGATRILILPAYPQYSGTTTAAVIDAVSRWSQQCRQTLQLSAA